MLIACHLTYRTGSGSGGGIGFPLRVCRIRSSAAKSDSENKGL